MNINFILNYINNITKDDVKDIALKQGILLNDDEVNGVYNYVKGIAKRFMYEKIDPVNVLEDLRVILSSNNYNKVLDLYDKYKDKL